MIDPPNSPRRQQGSSPSSPAIIFDLDGTLADTLDDLTDAMNIVLTEIDRPPVPREKMRLLIGEGIQTLIQRAAGIDDPTAIDALVQRYRPVYAARMFDKTRLYPDIPATLDALARDNIPMCVLSNKPHQFTQPICEVLLARWPFVEFKGHHPDAPRKPDPAAALDLARAMNRRPAEVYFVGDSDIDILTAHSAGMIPVAVTWGLRDEVTLRAAAAQFPDRPTHIIHTPTELPHLIQSHSPPYQGGNGPLM